MKTQRWTTKMLVTAAICIAMSYLLSFIKLWTMPTGGSLRLSPCCR